ncbi:porin family protein [Croceitalea marina]|uniref:Porin family protein n=1 Tax=Croceitalea marina TaxID=1775166 RepID=A0ABW5MXS1_9FLAO
MKIQKLTTVILVVASLSVWGQKPITPDYAKEAYKTNFGVKAGLNISNQTAKYDIPDASIQLTTTATSSFHIGFYGDFKLSEKTGVLAEALYSQEGSDVDLQGIDFKQRVNYIKVPLLLNYRPFSNGLSFQLGPQFGFMVKDTIELDNNDGDPFVDADFKSFEFSAVVGAEYRFTRNFKFGARYNLGISDISNTDEGTFRNRNFQLYVGFKMF